MLLRLVLVLVLELLVSSQGLVVQLLAAPYGLDKSLHLLLHIILSLL